MAQTVSVRGVKRHDAELCLIAYCVQLVVACVLSPQLCAIATDAVCIFGTPCCHEKHSLALVQASWLNLAPSTLNTAEQHHKHLIVRLAAFRHFKPQTGCCHRNMDKCTCAAGCCCILVQCWASSTIALTLLGMLMSAPSSSSTLTTSKRLSASGPFTRSQMSSHQHASHKMVPPVCSMQVMQAYIRMCKPKLCRRQQAVAMHPMRVAIWIMW